MRGGLRTRLVLDSVRLTIVAGLTARGWFNGTIYDTPPGPRRHRTLEYIPRPKHWDDPIAPNALAISLEEIGDNPLGLGGEVEDEIAMYCDIFAESDALGWDLAGDIHGILLGKFPEIGRFQPAVDVYDLRQPTPSPMFQVEVSRVIIDRAEGSVQEYKAHWFMVRLHVLDAYDDEFNAAHTVSDWTDDLAPTWALIQQIETSAP